MRRARLRGQQLFKAGSFEGACPLCRVFESGPASFRREDDHRAGREPRRSSEVLRRRQFLPRGRVFARARGSGTPLNLHRQLSPALARKLRFESKSGPKGLFFGSGGALDNQATRGVRELTRDSASLLDRIIKTTDALPRTGKVIIATESQLRKTESSVHRAEFQLPEEVAPGSAYLEGSVQRILVNRYERDPQARSACISAQGDDCCICGFSFGAAYGAEARGYIHIHHVRPLSENGREYKVDPAKDLRPVCPNCHAVLHLGGRCRSIEEVRQLLTAGNGE